MAEGGIKKQKDQKSDLLKCFIYQVLNICRLWAGSPVREGHFRDRRGAEPGSWGPWVSVTIFTLTPITDTPPPPPPPPAPLWCNWSHLVLEASDSRSMVPRCTQFCWCAQISAGGPENTWAQLCIQLEPHTDRSIQIWLSTQSYDTVSLLNLFFWNMNFSWLEVQKFKNKVNDFFFRGNCWLCCRCFWPKKETCLLAHPSWSMSGPHWIIWILSCAVW